MEILAKSESNGASAVTLAAHTQDVLAAARSVLDSVDTYLPTGVDKSTLRKFVLIGAVLHDIGKANNVFQQKIRGELRDYIQPVRHEIISALIVSGYVQECEEFSQWLNSYLGDNDNNSWMLSWIVGGHHLKMHPFVDDRGNNMVKIAGIPTDEVVFYANQLSEIYTILESVIKDEGISVSAAPKIKEFRLSTDIAAMDNHAFLVENYINESEEKAESLTTDERVLVAMAKGCLIAADIAGSALWNSAEQKIGQAISSSLRESILADDIQRIIDDRLGKGATLNNFQQKIATAGKRVLLEAACGSGKTIAAYAWAKQHEGRKLFFCYPTTGTSSAGFQDYIYAQSDIERDLLHSRSKVDIEMMRENDTASQGDKKNHATERDESVDIVLREDSLRIWGQQCVACTVDTVLGLMQNQRRGLYGFPAILRGTFVFDEIHSYDDKLFGSLLRFLDAFPDTPVLLMSASLPTQKREVLLKRHDWEVLDEPTADEDINRYAIERRGSSDECLDEVANALSNGSKILWVCNTVKSAMDIYNKFTERELPIKPILYHSRFRYCDRIKIQQDLINQFGKDAPCLAITTQVCEMSLDISANMLVTARSPFSAFVQRLGRLNRKAEYGDGAICLEYPFEGMPYSEEELKKTDELLKALADMPAFSQATLREKMKNIPADGEAKGYSAWIDDPAESGQASLRESDSSILVLREDDEEEIKQNAKSNNRSRPVAADVIKWTIPMLLKQKVIVVKKLGGYPVVSSDDLIYDEKTGARWA